MVNFVFCMAHFCEIHGPVTVLCTQRKESELSAKSSYARCESCSLVLPSGITSVATDFEDLVTKEVANGLSPQPSYAKTSGLGAHFKMDAKMKSSQQEVSEKVTYVSTLYPQSERIFTCLTKLVMKCLSVEAVAEPLKPIFFGDTNTGYCLSRIFSINDLHARGGERKYALMVVCDSERALLSNWEMASAFIAEIILLLQRNVETHMESTKLETGENGRYLRRAKTIPRSLVQLTGDNEIFMKLHQCGTEVLRSMQIP